MDLTKDQDCQNIDSGLGNSFGPDYVDKGESEVQTPQQDAPRLDEMVKRAFCPDEDNDTYLHVYIAKNSVNEALQMIQLCPEKGLLNIQNNLGQTPLHIASYVNSAKIVMTLIHHGADIELTDKDGKNVFHLCAERGHIESLAAIINMSMKTGQIQTALNLLNSRDFEGLSPFYRAVSNKHSIMCQSLFQLNVNVNLFDSKSGNSPLHEAIVAAEIDLEFIEFLVRDCKLNVNAQNYAGASPLHCAAARCDVESYLKLARLGAKVDIADIKGTIPISYGSTEFFNQISAS